MSLKSPVRSVWRVKAMMKCLVDGHQYRMAPVPISVPFYLMKRYNLIWLTSCCSCISDWASWILGAVGSSSPSLSSSLSGDLLSSAPSPICPPYNTLSTSLQNFVFLQALCSLFDSLLSRDSNIEDGPSRDNFLFNEASISGFC